MSAITLEAVLTERARMLDAICAALLREAGKLAFPGGCPIRVAPGTASYRLQHDPASGIPSLMGEWRDRAGCRHGAVVIHADGSCFAEYDVVRPHPGDRRWFVEAVTVWGREGALKSEPRLLPALE